MTLKKKKRNRRSLVKNPALDPLYNLKTRYEAIDYDYINKLSPEEKQWLNNFTEEYTNANFTHKGKKILKTKKDKKESFDRNNSRNRCVYTRGKASSTMKYLEDLVEHTTDVEMNAEEKLLFIEEIREKIDSITDEKLKNKMKNLYHTYYYTNNKR